MMLFLNPIADAILNWNFTCTITYPNINYIYIYIYESAWLLFLSFYTKIEKKKKEEVFCAQTGWK